LPGIIQLKQPIFGHRRCFALRGIIVPFLKVHHLAWLGISSVSYMFHSGYVENMKRKIMQREKKESKIPPCEGGEIKRGQIFNLGFVETLSHCFFLGALFKFTIEKIVYSVLLLILYSRKIITVDS